MIVYCGSRSRPGERINPGNTNCRASFARTDDLPTIDARYRQQVHTDARYRQQVHTDWLYSPHRMNIRAVPIQLERVP